MLTTEQVKEYLRIPGDSEDRFIQGIIIAGEVYLTNAVDDYLKKYESDVSFATLADAWLLTQWCPTMYDQREGGTAGGANLSFVAHAMLTQLQLMPIKEV